MRPDILEYLSQMKKREDNNKSKYLRKIGYYGTTPSPEEFKALAEAYEEANAYKGDESSALSNASSNPVGTVLGIIAVLTYIVSFILGIVLGRHWDEFEFVLALPYWVAGFIAGTMMLGFSEIIQLLQAIKDK